MLAVPGLSVLVALGGVGRYVTLPVAGARIRTSATTAHGKSPPCEREYLL